MIKNKITKNIVIVGFCAFTGLTLAGYAAIIDEKHNNYLYSKGEVENAWSSWVDVDSEFDCSPWSPIVSDVNYGTDFEQTQSCSQKQERTRDIYEEKSDGSKSYVRTEVGENVISVSNTNDATGDKDYVVNQTTSAWSSWSNNGGLTSCGSYSPATNTIESGVSFTQTRYCSQPQIRTQTVYDNWAKGGQTTSSTNTGTQTLTNQAQTRPATGTKPLEWTYINYQNRLTTCSGTTSTRPSGACSSKGAILTRCTIDSGAPGNNTYYAKTTYQCK